MTSPNPLSTLSSQPTTQTSTPPGNVPNKVDNLILRPTLGESIPYGQFYTIEWSATTSGNISVFYNTLLPSPSMTPISSCQNMTNYPEALSQCPWVAVPSPLPNVTNSGFEVVLVWNNTVEGVQVSPQFGVSKASLSTPSMASNLASASSTKSSTSSTMTSQPNDMAQSMIGLGVSLGLGVPLLVILIVGCIFLCRRQAKIDTSNATEVSPRASNIPRPGVTSRLERATRNPFNKNVDGATLLANYRNAEHFNFVPTPVNR
jgi:hypothetical protein